jgi:cellulose synthase/poly-beta-1,6-N-acetylglucosamine synthase-like glycosyltransferase
MLAILFWLGAAVVLYTYLGYGAVVWVWARLLPRAAAPPADFTPEVTLVVPAYNEADILEAKVKNCLAQDYPAAKLHLLFITDGSDDHSGAVLARFPMVRHLHQPQRAGKAMAENRAIRHVQTPFVVFTDCNTLLNPEAVRNLVRHYADPRVGAVSGEKRVLADGSTSGAGEGLYWRYESLLKRCDSAIRSLMGAAGELVSFRTALFAPLEADTILDDFIQSMRIVEAGHRVVYEPAAYALEPPSFSLKEEMKRKVRICAGGWQAMSRLPGLLRPWRQPVVSFLYLSHRVLRWSLTPLLLALLLPLNAALAATAGGAYWLLLGLQGAFYAAAALGWRQAARGRPAGPLLVPLYFTLMNVAVFQGFGRFVRRAQPAAWDKAQRAVAVG